MLVTRAKRCYTRREELNALLGFYNVSVILTYIGLCSAVCGMGFAMDGKLGAAVALLIVSGICDMFDGTIARATKRSKDAEVFGIQIDSLCDLVCFGVYPAVIAYSIGVRGVFGYIVLSLFVLGGVIRLGYFNVIEQKRQEETKEEKGMFHGLPITASAWLIPLFYLVRYFAGGEWILGLEIYMLVIAVLFVLDIKVRNPKHALKYVGAGVLVLAAVAAVLLMK